ncbi:MAG TPA: chemotaxis protein CheC [Verrucomicrobiae bacterium]|jgi:chemotaxis protein CheC|nr:chemotaxis protein CheC [Verrucomicrobiae bacterium]
MELTVSQKDALTELINIGYARAASALSDLTGHRITLEVPEVAIHLIAEITPRLQGVIKGEVASVNQVFSGPITGNAILLLDREAALLLNRLLTDRPGITGFDGAAREVITEVGNIVLNACLGAFGNLLKVQVSFTVPSLQIDDVQKVLRSITIHDKGLEYALIIHTHFYMRVNNVSGYLVIILGVTSLETLLRELKKWEDRELS